MQHCVCCIPPCNCSVEVCSPSCYALPLGPGALSDDARLTSVCLSHTSWIFMAPTSTGSKARWALQAWRKACMGWSWVAVYWGGGISCGLVHILLLYTLHSYHHTHDWLECRIVLELTVHHSVAPCGLRVVRIGPLHFLAGCRTRQLNQV